MVRPAAVSLEVIDIANPCPAEWDEMRGDERVRFCRHCSLNVYNLSAMPRGEAERLVAQREGRLCVRFFRRLDGTVVTADCEGALRLAARRAKRMAKALTAVVVAALLAPLGYSRWSGASPTDDGRCAGIAVDPPAGPPQERAMMGDIAVPVVPPPQPQERAFLGRMRAPAKMGEMAPMPLMGSPAPLPPPATQPAPATRPAETK
jgi:hypothetical protein